MALTDYIGSKFEVFFLIVLFFFFCLIEQEKKSFDVKTAKKARKNLFLKSFSRFILAGKIIPAVFKSQ